MKLLRLIIQQPQAHYRIPFTYKRRHTYPLPPYSTVFGFFVNLLGLYDQNSDDYKKLKKMKFSVAGKFESKSTEMIWFRNISKNDHKKRFGYEKNRKISGHIEHLGGQIPMYIDILNNAEIVIYLYHEDEIFVNKIYQNLLNPTNRLEILHLGRAEDWVIFKNEPVILNDSQIKIKKVNKYFEYFFWVPQKIFAFNSLSVDFNSIDGLLYNLPVFFEIKDYDMTFNRHGRRTFQYMRTKLNDGKILNVNLILDPSLNLPIFLGDFL